MKDVYEWFDKCPRPVVAKIIEKEHDLKHLISLAHLYSEDTMLVVIDLKRIAEESKNETTRTLL